MEEEIGEIEKELPELEEQEWAIADDLIDNILGRGPHRHYSVHHLATLFLQCWRLRMRGNAQQYGSILFSSFHRDEI